MWKAGYDPTAAVDLFERMTALEKKRPGTINKVFSTHPANGDRLLKTQTEIDTILPNKPEYVVNTSENMEMRERLFALENHRKNQESDPNRPRLRTSPGRGTVSADESEEKQDRTAPP